MDVLLAGVVRGAFLVEDCAFSFPSDQWDINNCTEPGIHAHLMQLVAGMLHKKLVLVEASDYSNSTNRSLITLLRNKVVDITVPNLMTEDRIADSSMVASAPYEFINLGCLMLKPQRIIPTTLDFFTHAEFQETFVMILATLIFLRIYNKLTKTVHIEYTVSAFFYNIATCCLGMIIALELALFSSMLSIDMFRSPEPALPFRTFPEFLRLVVEQKLIVYASSKTLIPNILQGFICDYVEKPPERCSEKALVRLDMPEEEVPVLRKNQRAVAVTLQPMDSIRVAQNCDIIYIGDISFPIQYRSFYFSSKNKALARQLDYTVLAYLHKEQVKYEQAMLRDIRKVTKCDHKVQKFSPLALQTAISLFHVLWGLAAAIIIWVVQTAFEKCLVPRCAAKAHIIRRLIY